MSTAPITLTEDDLADLVRIYMFVHSPTLRPWSKLTISEHEKWRDVLRRTMARRNELAREK